LYDFICSTTIAVGIVLLIQIENWQRRWWWWLWQRC